MPKLFYDIFPAEKFKKVGREISGIKPHQKTKERIFNVGIRILIVLIGVIYFTIGFSPKVWSDLLQIEDLFQEEALEKVNFYSYQCSGGSPDNEGGWQNPQNAQGPPEVPATWTIDFFSLENSAIYKLATSDIQQETSSKETANITCQQFRETSSGIDIDTKDREFKSAKIFFSLAIGNKEEIATFTPEIVTSTEDITTSTEEVNATPTEELTTSTEETATTSPEEEATTTEETSTSTEETTTSTEEFTENGSPITEETTTSSEESNTSTEEEATSTEKISFLTLLSLIDATTTTSTLSDDSATDNQLLTSDVDILTSTKETTTSTEEFTENGSLMTIWYSLDGEFWWQLNKISDYPLSNALNQGYFSYSAPFLGSWEDIQNLRIKFSCGTDAKLNAEQTQNLNVYLDAVWLEVNYRELEKKEEIMEVRPPSLTEVGSPEIEFTYTDDNSGENLIIKTDKQVYEGLTGVTAYFSITNTGQNPESVNLLFHFPKGKGNIAKIEKWQDNQWQSLTLLKKVEVNETFFSPEVLQKRKFIPEEFEIKRRIQSLIEAGGTVYFKTEIKFPPKSSGEFYIETLGHQEGYGLLDPWWI